MSDVVRKGPYWKENRWSQVYHYKCSSCGKHRETRDKEKANSGDDVCSSCKKARLVPEGQSSLF